MHFLVFVIYALDCFNSIYVCIFLNLHERDEQQKCNILYLCLPIQMRLHNGRDEFYVQ